MSNNRRRALTLFFGTLDGESKASLVSVGIADSEAFVDVALIVPELVEPLLLRADALAAWGSLMPPRTTRRRRSCWFTDPEQIRSRIQGLELIPPTAEKGVTTSLLSRLHRFVKFHGGVPRSVSLVHRIVRVHDQKRTPACAGESTAAAVEIATRERLSGGFVYLMAKRLDGKPGPGTTLQAAFLALSMYGVCSLACFPEAGDESRLLPEPPPAAAMADASRRRIKAWATVDPADSHAIMSALALGIPVVVGLAVFSSWAAAARKGKILDRLGPHDRLLGHHAVLLVGYDLTGENSEPSFLFLNSHGANWPLESQWHPGVAQLPPAYLSRHGCGAVIPDLSCYQETREAATAEPALVGSLYGMALVAASMATGAVLHALNR